MPKPKTKAGKKAKVRKVMSEHKRGTLKSSSGAKVTKRRQAVAIALSVSGQARKDRRKKRK
jgi:predicted nucleic acid-binding Zn ribbon protein